MRKIDTKLQFNVVFRPEKEGGFTAMVPLLPGCISYGKTLSEAKNMISDAINGYIFSIHTIIKSSGIEIKKFR